MVHYTRVSELAGVQRAGSSERAALFTEFPSGQTAHDITGVCDAAGCQELISPGSIVSVYGLFAVQTVTADSLPLNFDLDGFSVTFNGLPGSLFGVFFREDFGALSDQANVQVPWELDVSSGEVEVRVHWEGDAGTISSEPFVVSAAPASPGIFMVGTRAIVTNFGSGQDDVIPGSWAQPQGFLANVTGQPAAVGGVIIVCDVEAACTSNADALATVGIGDTGTASADGVSPNGGVQLKMTISAGPGCGPPTIEPAPGSYFELTYNYGPTAAETNTLKVAVPSPTMGQQVPFTPDTLHRGRRCDLYRQGADERGGRAAALTLDSLAELPRNVGQARRSESEESGLGKPEAWRRNRPDSTA